MVKTYGPPDCERKFLGHISGKFKSVDITSVERLRDFQSNPDSITRKIVSRSLKRIEELKAKKKACEQHIYYLKSKIDEDDREIAYRKNGLKLYPLSEKIALALAAAENSKSTHCRELKQEEQETLRDVELELAKAWEEHKTTIRDLDADTAFAKTLFNDKELGKILRGYDGERAVIAYIEKQFANLPDAYLINSINIDAIGDGHASMGKLYGNVPLDHLLLCRKGCFILETKNWESYNEANFAKIIEQLRRQDVGFREHFGKKIGDENISIVLVLSSKEDLSLACLYPRLKLDELSAFINEKADKLTHDDVICILYELLPLMDGQHKIDKTPVKIKKMVISGKRMLNRIGNAILTKVTRKKTK